MVKARKQVFFILNIFIIFPSLFYQCQKDLDITVSPNTTIQKNLAGIPLIHDTSFFPIGIYENCLPTDIQSINRIKSISECGFNCVLNYSLFKDSIKNIFNYIDNANQQGLKIIFPLNSILSSSAYKPVLSWKSEEEIFKGYVSTFKSHNSILAWYLNDECPISMHSKLIQHYKWLKELDTIHPAYIVIDKPKDISSFTNTTDIFGVDPYPIPFHPITRVSDWTDLAISTNEPAWVVIQIFDWALYKPIKPNPPSYEEIKCMIYLALTHGASGLLFYSYSSLCNAKNFSEKWDTIKIIINELNKVVNWIKNTKSNSFLLDNPFHIKTWHKDSETLIVAANSEKKIIPFKFKADKYHTIKKFLTGETIDLKDGYLTSSFGPLEVQIYIAYQ